MLYCYVLYDWNWTFVLGCGGTESLTDHSLTYTLISPGYPGTYPNSIDCEWVLKVPEGYVVDFSITEFLNNHSCRTDDLFFYSGSSIRSPFIGSSCGSQLHNKHYKSSRNVMLVRLLTGYKPDDSISFFKATWKIGELNFDSNIVILLMLCACVPVAALS